MAALAVDAGPDEGPESKPARRRYHVALTASEVLERLADQPGVKAYAHNTVPDLGGAIVKADYTLELGEREFSVHVGPPAARGQSATGMHRVLYLRGRLRPTRAGTVIEVSFAQRRPRWALLRWVGFLALCSLGLAWVLVGPGVMAKKAVLYGFLVLILTPVVIDDLRRKDQLGAQRKDLLNLLEHTFGAIQIDDPHADEPYRRALPRLDDDPLDELDEQRDDELEDLEDLDDHDGQHADGSADSNTPR